MKKEKRKYCVSYEYLVIADSEVEASSQVEAGTKVKEVMPDVVITGVWEVK